MRRLLLVAVVASVGLSGSSSAQEAGLKRTVLPLVHTAKVIEHKTLELVHTTEGIEESRSTKGGIVTIQLGADVLFEFDKSDLTPAAQQRLGGVADELKKGATGQVKIDGYTDNVGDAAYNQSLSERRAESVRAFLAGATPGLTYAATGHGAADPVAPNDSDANRARNRRVTITYTVKR